MAYEQAFSSIFTRAMCRSHALPCGPRPSVVGRPYDRAARRTADKRLLILVGASVSTVPEVAAAPNATNALLLVVCPPNSASLEVDSDQSSGPGQNVEKNGLSGSPKPFKVHSVPQTPADPTSSAGSTPRPELTIQEEPASSSKALDKPVVMMEVTEPQPIPSGRAEKSENDDAWSDAATGKATAPNGTHKPAPASSEDKSVSAIALPASAFAPQFSMAGSATEPTALTTGRKREIEDIACDTSSPVEPEGLSAGAEVIEKKAKVDWRRAMPAGLK